MAGVHSNIDTDTALLNLIPENSQHVLNPQAGAVIFPDQSLDTLPVSQTISIFGWGATDHSGNIPGNLMKGRVKFLGPQNCTGQLALGPHDVCIGNDLAGQAAACGGDSGGGVVTPHGGWSLLGVMSRSDSSLCGSQDAATMKAVATPGLCQWISNTIGSNTVCQ